MRTKDHHLVGLALGSVFGLLHLSWLVLVELKWAKPLVDWILDLHHISFQYSIADLNISKAVLLVVVTFVFGYILGLIFSEIWTVLKKKG